MVVIDEELSKKNLKEIGNRFLSERTNLLLELRLLAENNELMELERRYRQLISVPDPNLTFTDMINIKSNLAIIGVIYLAESTSNLSDYEPGVPNVYSIILTGPDKKLSTLQLDTEKMISKIENYFRYLFMLRESRSIDLSVEVMDAFNTFRMLKHILSLDPICIMPPENRYMSWQLYGKPWKEVCPPMDTLTVREILANCSQYITD